VVVNKEPQGLFNSEVELIIEFEKYLLINFTKYRNGGVIGGFEKNWRRGGCKFIDIATRVLLGGLKKTGGGVEKVCERKKPIS
jgi:hypothetical protein